MRHHIAVFLAVALASLSTGCNQSATSNGSTIASTPVPEPVWLPQGWNKSQSQWFYHLANQGSHLVPYDWFLWLEQDTSPKLFRDNDHIEKLRFLPEAPDPGVNPDGLPVGFVKDPVPDDKKVVWLGLTCAACHTCQIVYDNVAYRIDGGPGQGDIQSLLEELTAALKSTHDDASKFARFADHVLGTNSGDSAARNRLREELGGRVEFRQEFDHRNATAQRYGFARVDAFGIILNEVLQHALQVPGNGKPPNAPVSYPFLWDTPQHDFVQWNGAAPNQPLGTHFIGPLSRNVGEVLGVFGEVIVGSADNDLDGYPSSVRRVNLLVIEELLKKLESPQWPKGLPQVDAAMAAQGRALYDTHCLKCHARIERDNPDRTVKAIMTPVDALGTDSLMAKNFADRRADPGPLKGAKRLFLIGEPFGQDEPAADVLVHVIAGVILRRPFETLSPQQVVDFEQLLGGHELLDVAHEYSERTQATLQGGHDAISEQLLAPLQLLYKPSRADGALVYKARPLNGIWATAPYLHNGSVPNLAQLLLPAKDRVPRFYVGSREFDPVTVGFKSDQRFDGAFEFRVKDDAGLPIPGNSNSGHEYCNDLTDTERNQLLEYLKTL